MARTSTALEGRSAAPSRPALARLRWLPCLVLAVAFAARLVPVLRGGGLSGLHGYDDGVYFGAADALLFGRLPYRDFLFLHPPGVLLALSPFAALGRLTSDPTGLAAARLAFMAMGAVNAVLVYLVARRAGQVAALVAGFLYAVWGPAAYAERTALLEPLVTLGVLVAAVLLGDVQTATRRRLLAAGAVLGAVVAVKLWAVLPLLVVAGWVWRRGRGRAGVLVGAAAAAATGVCLVFFVAAPATMLRMVFADQLGRPSNGIPAGHRLAGIFGTYHAAGATPGLAEVVGSVVLASVVAVSMLVVVRRRPDMGVWVVLLVAQVALLLVGPVYYDHYAAFAAPALVIVLGTAAGAALTPVPRNALARTAAAIACLAVLGPVVMDGPVHPEGRRLPVGRVDRAVGDSACVRADSAAALVVTNLLTRNLRHGCPVTIDFTGTTYDLRRSSLTDGRPGATRRSDAVWQQFLRRYVSTRSALLILRFRADGFGPDARAALRSHRVVLRSGQLTVYAARR